MTPAEGYRRKLRDEAQRFEVFFGTLESDHGLAVTDPIERHQFRLFTSRSVSPVDVDPTRFWFPADAAVRIETSTITLPSVVAVCVRDEAGDMIAEANHFAEQSVPHGRYSLELCAPIKIYLRVESSVSISADASRTQIDFGEETTVLVGARSRHEQPAATITTTDDPEDVMAAVSAFSSSLKTTSPERSYPTLRGHPPLVELGEELHIPEGIEPAATDVKIELPPTLRNVYVVTPLAFYLGATLTPGPRPRIVTSTDFEYALDTAIGFEREVERVLKQTFFFDCITRTEGYYKLELHERREIEKHVDFEFDELYDDSLANQLETYLSVPYSTVEPYLPEWKLTSHIAPTSENVELLPFLTNDLAIVKTPRATPASGSVVQADAAGEFFRDNESSAAASQFFRNETFTRSASEPSSTQRSYVQPEPAESLEQVWVGDGTPIGASKATPKAYLNRLARSPASGASTITVVCNDEKMAAERDLVDDVYSSRDDLPFDIRMHYDLTVDELRSLLTTQTEFLHYIGHIDGEGFECADGKLDATTLTVVGPDSFLLNACQSYEQGMALIESGAIGGIVTLSDVINSGAVEMGLTLARLLNRGFPLRSALEIARDDSVIGEQYTVIGDGGLSIAQAESGMPNICEVRKDGESYELDFKAYPMADGGMGSVVSPHLLQNDEYFLSSGTVETFRLSKDELKQFLLLEDIPLRMGGQLRWSSDIALDEL
ncbi:MAG: hypothetical protein ACQETI_08880 [Halobacteriota archaeon]